jgi:hypothetical protein
MNRGTNTVAFSGSTSDDGKIARLLRERHRIIINDPSCAWSEYLENRLEELIRLPVGWDGYRARPVSFPNASYALSVLEQLHLTSIRAPDLVPGYQGDLQAEWHIGNVDIELHVLAPNQVHAWRLTPTTGPDGEELSLTNDFTVVGSWIRELAGGLDAVTAAAM